MLSPANSGNIIWVTPTRLFEGSPISTTVTYNVLGHRLTQTDARGSTSEFFYDSLYRPVATKSPEGVVITSTYNVAGQVLTSTNNLGHATGMRYDELGRLVRTLDAEQNETQYEYDILGNQVAVIDANSVRTSYQYDALRRLGTVIENNTGGSQTDDSNIATHYTYNVLGSQISIINGRGITVSSVAYDALYRPTVITDALGHTSSSQYNALGMKLSTTDANGDVTHYGYDDLNRPITVTYAADGETVLYTYNALGSRLLMTDSLGTTQYQYDDFSRLETVTDPFNATVGYGYDVNGNRTQLTYPPSTGSGQVGKVVTYTYDADGRLWQVEDWNNELTRYSFDDIGRLITTTLPNGVVSVNQYDDANRLLRLSHTAADDSLLADYQYEVDGVGNRQMVTETQQVPSLSERFISFGEVPATAYSVQDDAYLVVWQGEEVIYGQRIAGDGSLIGESFAIGEGLDASVAYSSAENAYLVVWQDGSNIWARLVSVSPEADSAEPFRVYAPFIYAPVSQPDVAYSEAANSFLVSWRAASMTESSHIQARIVKGAGGELGRVSTLTSSSYGVSDPAVAAAHDGSFLVVWRDGRNNNDIYGTIFNGKSSQGTTPFAPFAIAQSQSNATIPDVAWNETGGMYLVTWQNNHLFANSSDIQGYRVSVSGNLIGSLTTMDNNPAVARPSLTVAADKWLITWQQGSNPEDLYGRFMFPDGSVGVEILPLVTSDAAQTAPAVMGGQPNGDYLLTWQDDRDGNAAIYSRLFSELSEQETTTTITYEYDPLYRLTEAAYTSDLDALYQYVYDPVGNMKAYTETVSTGSGQTLETNTTRVTRYFDDANRLMTATDFDLGSSSYIYDNNGNLTLIVPPGNEDRQLYDFNQRNLMVSHSLHAGGMAPIRLQATFGLTVYSKWITQVAQRIPPPMPTTFRV